MQRFLSRFIGADDNEGTSPPQHHTPLSSISTSSADHDFSSPDINAFLDNTHHNHHHHQYSTTTTAAAAFPTTKTSTANGNSNTSKNQASLVVDIPTNTTAAGIVSSSGISGISSKLFMMDSSSVNVLQPSDLEYPSILRPSTFNFDNSSSSSTTTAGVISMGRPPNRALSAAAGVVSVVDTQGLDYSKLSALNINSNNNNGHQVDSTTTTPKRSSMNYDGLLDSEDSMSQLSIPSSCKSDNCNSRSTRSKISTSRSIASKTPLGTSSSSSASRKREYLALSNNFNSFYNSMIENQNCILNALSEKNQEIISEISQSSQSINDMGFKINDFIAQQVACLKMDLERDLSQVESKNDQLLNQLLTHQTQLISHIQTLNQTVKTNQEEIKNLKLYLTGSICVAIVGVLTQFLLNKSPRIL